MRHPAVVSPAVAVILLVLLGHGALDVMVGAPVRATRSSSGQPRTSIENSRYRAAVQNLIPAPLTPGNHFELLTSGRATYGALWRDLRSATRSVTLQVYYCQPSAVADSLREVLVEKAEAGVEVLVLLDGVGCRELPGSYLEELREAGVEVHRFRPVRWYDLHRAQHRSHVRAVVIDGTLGYTGGFGIDDKWLNNSDPGAEWRETNVRFIGPAVAQLQGAFAAGWAETTGELLAGDEFFPATRASVGRSQRGGIIFSTPVIGTSPAERLLALSIEGATRTLFITNPYFLPDADFRRLLARAARRGVDVRVLTAGVHTDVPLARLAGRAGYAEMLRAGVQIFEFRDAMIHAKSLVVDGTWSSVGTMNFDNRSLRLNEELNLVSDDATLAASLEALFRSQLREAERISPNSFADRPWTERLQEIGARLIWFLL